MTKKHPILESVESKMEPGDREIAAWISTPSGLCEAVASLYGEPLKLDPWQREYIDFNGKRYILNKSRQAGFSLASACRGWARAYLSPANSYNGVFISINLADAREKVRWVDMLDECMPAKERMKRVVSTQKEIEWKNGNRIVALFDPRGKGYADVMLDELAHMTDSRLVYNAAGPATLRGGAILAGSSPLDRNGIFFDIWTGAEGKFQNFVRVEVPWWKVTALCSDVGRAVVEAPGMATAERVARFGGPALKDLFESMFLEDFQCECECAWADESTALLPWELILACSPTDSPVLQIASIGGIHELTGEVFVGIDIGRRINATEIVVGERFGTGKIEERFRVTMQNRPLPEQEAVCAKILEHPNVKVLTVDYTGLGLHMGDSLVSKYGSQRIKLVAMSGVSKPQIATNMRSMMEREMYSFYPDREVRRQFHSVKKIISPSGNVIYDSDRNEKMHADKFWASALMLWGAADRNAMAKPCIGVLRTIRKERVED